MESLQAIVNATVAKTAKKAKKAEKPENTQPVTNTEKQVLNGFSNITDTVSYKQILMSEKQGFRDLIDGETVCFMGNKDSFWLELASKDIPPEKQYSNPSVILNRIGELLKSGKKIKAGTFYQKQGVTLATGVLKLRFYYGKPQLALLSQSAKKAEKVESVLL